MKLGKDTGSLINWALGNRNYVCPEVGMDATELHWSDRSAWRVIKVDDDKKGCVLQRYAPKLIGDFYEQNYQYEDENGNPLLSNQTMHIRYKYKKWKNGAFDVNIRFGCRDEYYDPSF